MSTILNEVVLPSGAFAAVRTFKVADMVAFTSVTSGILPLVVLTHRCVTFDGEPKTVDQILAMDAYEVQPVFELLKAQLEKVLSSKKGVA